MHFVFFFCIEDFDMHRLVLCVRRPSGHVSILFPNQYSFCPTISTSKMFSSLQQEPMQIYKFAYRAATANRQFWTQ